MTVVVEQQDTGRASMTVPEGKFERRGFTKEPDFAPAPLSTRGLPQLRDDTMDDRPVAKPGDGQA